MSKFQINARKTQKLNLFTYKNSFKSSSHNAFHPCDLGIIFFDDDSHSLFGDLKREISAVFNSNFSSIKKILMKNHLSYSKGKERRVRLRKTLIEVFLYPTEPFYEIISELKIRNAFDIGVGVTELPIYSSSTKNLIFLYGEAHLYHNCAIISTYNLKYELIPSPNCTLQQRVIKEVIHELGHLILGSKHCRNKKCVMSFSKSLGDIDSKAFYLCNECKCKLEEIF